MVKKILPLVGTLPFLLISFGLIRTKASSANAEKELNAWLDEAANAEKASLVEVKSATSKL